jgi:tripartite-type tricarboxylate transporter receptor subunit TctC
VPYPAGGGTDTVSRTIAQKLSEDVKQPVVIDNRAGGDTIIGTTAIANAPADGHTIGLITDSLSINAAFGRHVPYDPEKSFAPIIVLLRVPLVLIVNSSLVPMTTLPELVRHSKDNPEWLTFASLGTGGPHELGMLWFKKMSGIRPLIVSYKGIAPALNDLVGGHVKAMFIGSAVADGLIKAGKVHTIAVSSGTRLPSGPDIPTFAEQGYPEFEFVTWYGMVAPGKTPPEIVRQINAALNHAMQSPEVKERISSVGGEPAGGAPDDLRQLISAETAKYRKIIQETGAKQD